MKKHIFTIILVMVFLVGISVLLYPTVSDWWNNRTQSRAIIDYDKMLESAGNEDYEEEFKAGEEYNRLLAKTNAPLVNYESVSGYENLFDPIGTGMMGYISIPKISVELPVYHGTSTQVLNRAVGHIEGTSLPTGGVGTHTVFSGHRGLPSAKLFSDLDKLEVGDTFTVTILNKKMVYEVDQIRIVLPEETEDLAIDEEHDYCTLVTCTPYGVNSHRLLVRGERIYGSKSIINVQNEAYEMESLLLAPMVAAPILIVLFIYLLWKTRKKKDKGEIQ